jgi:transcription termination/antitermination protein NusA
MNIKISHQEILYMTAFDNMTNVMAKNCVVDGDMITFVVDEKDVGQAIGKKGVTIKLLRDKLRKQVSVLPYAVKVKEFVEKAFPEVTFTDFKEKERDNGKGLAVKVDQENKEKLLKNARKLASVKTILKKTFGIEHLIVTR